MKIKFFRRRVHDDHRVTLGVTTQCVVYDENGLVLCDATIHLHPSDRDDRRVARKISLTQALSLVDDKQLRSAVWDQFWREYA